METNLRTGSVNELPVAADLAAQSYASTVEAIGALLDLMHRILGMSTPFVTMVRDGVLTVIASTVRGSCDLPQGLVTPSVESY